jgi:hypothetical protein
MLACASAGGVLWALSPLGIQLSELKYHTPNVFWKLFFPAPLLLMIGLVGLYLWVAGRSGWLEKAGLFTALLGTVLIVSGDVGKFWLGLDETYLMTAPAYRAFRLGLLLLAAGCILFGVATGRNRTLPVWGALPFAIGALCGVVSFSRDLGSFGTALWILFGIGWAWIGLGLLAKSVISSLLRRTPVASHRAATGE